MKKFEITKEQILQLNSYNNYDCGIALKEWFPQAFENKLQLNKWYKEKKEFNGLMIVYITKINGNDSVCCYGFSGEGIWFDNHNDFGTSNLELATDKEVETALIEEAKRRGYEEGIEYFNASLTDFKEKAKSNMFEYCNSEDDIILYLDGNTIFYNGKWAEIINEPLTLTIDEIAEKFGTTADKIKICK